MRSQLREGRIPISGQPRIRSSRSQTRHTPHAPRYARPHDAVRTSPARRNAPEPAAWLPIPDLSTLEIPVVAASAPGDDPERGRFASAPRGVEPTTWESPARQDAPDPAVWVAIPDLSTLEVPVVIDLTRDPKAVVVEYDDITLVPHRLHHHPGTRPTSPASPTRRPPRRVRRVTVPEPVPVVPTAPAAPEPGVSTPADVPELLEPVPPVVEADPATADPAPTGRAGHLAARRAARLRRQRRRRFTALASTLTLGATVVAFLAVGGGATSARARVRALDPPAPAVAATGGIAGVTVLADGRTVPVEGKNLETVADALTAAGVALGASDEVAPPLASALTAGTAITVTRVTRDTVEGRESVAFKTIVRDDASLAKGATKVVTAGRNGVIGYRMSRTLKNGAVAAETRIGSWVISSRVDQVIARGTRSATTSRPSTSHPPAAPAPAPAPGHVQVGSATHYGTNPYGAGYCASRTAPKGTRVTVTNTATGATTSCIVNDYGPAAWTGRILDLHPANFAQIAPISQGVVNVRVTW